MNVTGVLTHRDSLGFWLNGHGLLGEGVEVGSAYGGYAAIVLSTWKGKKLSMIDPWIDQPASEYREKHDGVRYDIWYQDCLVLSARDNRANLVRGFSVDAAPLFADRSLDFVYIDGNHDYGHVMQDLDLWSIKVKKGGLLGGHDFCNNTANGSFIEVESAVLRWAAEHHTVFSVTPCSSYWMIV